MLNHGRARFRLVGGWLDAGVLFRSALFRGVLFRGALVGVLLGGALLGVLLGGCELFGGKGTRLGGSEHSSSGPNHLSVTLVSHCARPVELCYGAPATCVTLAANTTRTSDASTGGAGDVFVSFKGAQTGIFTDQTFDTIDVEESCTSLRRRLHR